MDGRGIAEEIAVGLFVVISGAFLAGVGVTLFVQWFWPIAKGWIHWLTA